MIRINLLPHREEKRKQKTAYEILSGLVGSEMCIRDRTPAGVYLKSFKQEGQKVSVLGYAQSQERVSELLRNLAGVSPWLERPDLIEVKSTALGQGKTSKKVVEFNLMVHIKRPRDKDKPPGDKGGPKPGPAGTSASATVAALSTPTTSTPTGLPPARSQER